MGLSITRTGNRAIYLEGVAQPKEGIDDPNIWRGQCKTHCRMGANLTLQVAEPSIKKRRIRSSDMCHRCSTNTGYTRKHHVADVFYDVLEIKDGVCRQRIVAFEDIALTVRGENHITI